uniref:hypothetical protein n=1 Tax=Devosia sp. TaxID=1871048 RepID=UPI0035AE4EEB
MNLASKTLLSAALVLSSFAAAPAVFAEPLRYGPDTCAEGFVWRDAAAGDHVCVKPAGRQRAAEENALAASRVDPTGAYGPLSCVAGFVWREAFSGDMVCVTPDRRDAVANENRLGPSRMALAYGPDTCRDGFVWRDAAPGDHVCVTPTSRNRAASENAAALTRVDPAGAYGPFTCVVGYV